MIKKLRTLNDVLPEMLAGILFFGIVCEITGVFFVEDKWFYSTGLLVGVLIAMAMAVHMAWSLQTAMDLGETGVVKQMQKNNLLRYAGVLTAFGILIITGLGNPLSAFLGVMGLKVAAYLEPVTHKIFRR